MHYTKKERSFKENWTAGLEENSWIMKSRKHIIKFLYNFSTLSSTIVLLDQSYWPSEQTDLLDALQSTHTTHSANIRCQNHEISLLQLTGTGDMGRIFMSMR